MATSISKVKFELSKVYKTYVEQLALAGSVSGLLLANVNIDSAGEQVEGSLRALLQELLPERIRVAHGHIVDKQGEISHQQDILLTDSLNTRSLIKTLDGTEFYPYESVFVNGEIKRSWNQRCLKGAIDSIRRIKSILQRNEVARDVINSGSHFMKVSQPLTNNPYRNPLFSFSFSLNMSTTYSQSSITAFYEDRANWRFLPNMSVILDSGLYVLLDNDALEMNKLCIKLYPEFVGETESCKWYFLQLEPEECLAYLVFMLTQHVNDTILEKPVMLDYGTSLFQISLSNLKNL